MTIVLAPAVEAAAAAPHGPCVAIVEWGNGSGTAIAEVDFAKGSVIQVAGSYLLIDGRNDGAVADGAKGTDPDAGPTTIDPAPGEQTVAVIVSGYGPRPAGRATRTFYGRDLRRGEARTFPVPNFAKAVVVGRMPVSDSTIALEIGDASDEPTLLRDGPHVFAGVAAGSLNLYPTAGGVTVRNVGRTVVDSFQVVFELAL